MNGSLAAVVAIAIPATKAVSPPAAKAMFAFVGTVTKAPSTNKNPWIDSPGTYFPSFGKSPINIIIPSIAIIKIPEFTGLSLAPVAEIIASTGAPPKSEETESARPE